MAGHLRHNPLELSEFCESSMSACANYSAEEVSSFHKHKWKNCGVSLQRAHAIMSLKYLQGNRHCRGS